MSTGVVYGNIQGGKQPARGAPGAPGSAQNNVQANGITKVKIAVTCQICLILHRF